MRKLKTLTTKHQQLARLLVGGHSQAEICRLLDMHKSTVSRLVKDPLVAEEVRRLQEMADVSSTTCVPGIPGKVAEGAHKGMDVLRSILEDERLDIDILKLKANVSLELLARAGYGPIKQLNIKQTSMAAHFTMEDIERIKERAKELSLWKNT